MKKVISLFLIFMIVFSLWACSGSDGTATKENATANTENNATGNENGENGENDAAGTAATGLQVGFNRQSITPTEIGVPIAGGDSSARLSTGFIDEVATTCIAFSMNEETYLIYTCDFMVVYDRVLDPVKVALENATGVPQSNIVFNCTHTHSGVNVYSDSWDGASAYRELFSKRCLKAAEKALENLAPATISYGSTQTEGMTFVRHYLMNDGTTSGNGHGSSASGYKEHLYPADEELQIIKFTREGEKDIMIASFPSHATTVNGTNSTSISACYPGAFREAVEEEADVHCAFFQGASGDQVPTSKIDELNAVFPKNHKTYGQKLAEYALSVELKPMDTAKLVFKRWEYTGNSMKEGTEDISRVAQAQEIVTLSSQKSGYTDPEVTALVNKYGFSSYLEASGLVSRVKAPETRSMDLLALQLGSEVSMVFAPYEMFGMHGKYIKDNSPFEMDFIVTCSEDYQGYFPHIQGCDENFYEYDVTKYERGTGEKLAELFATTLAEMKAAG